MRIAIDLQGAQSESRYRGIGRFSLSLALALARNRGTNEVVIGLNGMFADTIEPVRSAFEGVLPQECIRVWHATGPTRDNDPSNDERRRVAELVREAFFADLRADVVLIMSLFEGLGDEAIGSIGLLDTATPTAVVLHDLIPLINPDVNFRTNHVYKDWYGRKIDSLKRAQLLLANSESSRQEALQTNCADPADVITILAACDDSFRELTLSDAERAATKSKAGISKPFVMYTGGADERKNLPRLIEAFAGLPRSLRSMHQLAFIGRMPQPNVEELLSFAADRGLSADDLVFPGYVDDRDLRLLYNTCRLFVFPSTHEGFGIPPLEAMSCGAPVIASRATSLTEVVGLDEALFDPLSVDSIASKMSQALSDEAFRSRLVEHGRKHAKTFSWDESARRAWRAMARFDGGASVSPNLRFERTTMFAPRPMRIAILKLDHMGDFLLALPAISKLKARYPDASIDAIVGTWSVPIATGSGLFDRVHAFDFFKKVSAVAPSAMQESVQTFAADLGPYDTAIDLRRQRDTRFILMKIDARQRVGYQTFDAAMDAGLDICLKAEPDEPHVTTRLNNTHISKQMLALVDALPADDNDYVRLPKFGMKEQAAAGNRLALFPVAGNEVKQWPAARYAEFAQHLLDAIDDLVIDVFFASKDDAASVPLRSHHRLNVRVGLSFDALIAAVSQASVCVANNSFGAHLGAYAGCTVIGIYGGHETVAEWAPVFGESYVIHRAASCSPCHLPSREQCPYGFHCMTDISVEEVCTTVQQALAGRGQTGDRSLPTTRAAPASDPVSSLIAALGEMPLRDVDGQQCMAIARCIARNHRPAGSRRQLLVDISELVQRDAKSGIQRVVRAVLAQLLAKPPEGFVVEPVQASTDRQGYRYARGFANRVFSAPAPTTDDGPVEAWAGDVFLGLDLHPQVAHAQREELARWRSDGVKVYFVVYDLIPVLLPTAFPDGAAAGHHRWLETIAQFDGAIAISRSTMDDMRDWLDGFGPQQHRPFRLGWFHLGSDVQNSHPTTGLPPSAKSTLAAMSRHRAFVAVGTVEPRKGHALALAAFERLWSEGRDVILVIVGKEGWMVDELSATLRNHPQIGKRLFWLESISDEYLELVYRNATALLAPSEAEGFGLPLIEAARHGVPIIARNLPVFREVAGAHAFYFDDDGRPQTMAQAVSDWLLLREQRRHPTCDGMTLLDWKQSTQQLLDVILDNGWSHAWRWDGVYRFWGSDPRLHLRVGARKGKSVHGMGREGQLFYGPYQSLAAGRYSVALTGKAEQPSGREWFDIVCDQGRREVMRAPLANLQPGEWRHLCEFELESAVTDLEIRFYAGPNARIQVDLLEIAPSRIDMASEQRVDTHSRVALAS